MPIFEYRCENCNKEFEVFTLRTNGNNTVCKLCGSKHVHRIISPVGIIFKGSGFYITDSKKQSSLNSVSVDKPKEKEEKTEKVSSDVTEKVKEPVNV